MGVLAALVLTSVLAVAPANALSCGETITESIAVADEEDTFNLTGVSSGNVITLRMHRTSGFLTPRLELRDAGNNLVASNAGATLTLTLPSNGPFTVSASDDDENDTGDYELFLERLDGACNPTLLACGARVAGTLPTRARIHAYDLGGVSSGDVVTVRMHRTSGFLGSYLELYNGSGTLVQEGGGATLTLTLPSSGPYTLIARDDNYGDSGDYGVSLERLDGGCNAPTLKCGARVGDAIATRDEIDNYSLSGVGVGDVVTLRMHATSGFLTSQLELYDGAGALLAEDTGATLTLTLPSSGPYTLIARDDNYGDSGDYGVSLERLDGGCNAPTLKCGARVGDAIATGDEIDGYSLSGVGVGDVVTLRMHATSGFLTSQLELYDGAGALLAEDTGATLTLTLPSSGPYTLIARDDNYGDSGDYGVSLQRLNGACNAIGVACGENVLGSVTTGDEIDSYSITGVTLGDSLTFRLVTVSGFLKAHAELFDGSGNLLGEGSGPTPSMTLSGAGPYTALLRDDDYGASGDYMLFPQRFDSPCGDSTLSLGETKAATLSTLIEIDTFALEGVEPQDTVTLCMDALADVGPAIELYDATGTLLGSDSTFFDGGIASLSTTLSAPGPFTALTMDDSHNDLGDYEISLRGATSSCATTDAEPPTVTPAAPGPGELLAAGSPYRIKWSSADDVGVTSHTLRLSTDGGATYPTVIASGLSGAAQSYLWTVPATVHSTTARIRVIARDATGASGQAETAGDFLIVDDPMPREISYTYDALNRLTGVEYSDGSTITYVYDEVGNRTSMTSTRPTVIHGDGFESGDTSGWTDVVGSVAAASQAARSGGFGLRVAVGCVGEVDLVVPDGDVASGVFEGCRSVIAGAVRVDPGPVTFRAGDRVRLGDGFSVASGAGFTAEIDPTVVPDAHVRDDSPAGEDLYGASFAVRLDGLALEAGDRVELFSGLDGGGLDQFRLVVARSAGENRLFLEARRDDGSYASTSASPVPIPDGWHTVEINWRAAEPGTADGRLDLALDGTPRARLTSLDNDSGRIDAVTLGATGAGGGSSGLIDLDDFVSQPQV